MGRLGKDGLTNPNNKIQKTNTNTKTNTKKKNKTKTRPFLQLMLAALDGAVEGELTNHKTDTIQMQGCSYKKWGIRKVSKSSLKQLRILG